MNLADLDASELLVAFDQGEASPTEALESSLQQINDFDQRLFAMASVDQDGARAAARESTRRWHKGIPRRLEGIPFGIKDVIDTAGIPTRAGSTIYHDRIPTTSAPCVSRLQDAGANLIGKLRTSEFAFTGEHGESCRNPWDTDRSPAGSSNGPAAALAARYFPVALGTDTGGSIRIPAAFCGVLGLRPTYGRVSRRGVLPVSWTMDTVGPMARSAADLSLLMHVIAVNDNTDLTLSPGAPDFDLTMRAPASVDGLSIGVPTNWVFDVCDPIVTAATEHSIDILKERGARIVPVELPNASIAETIHSDIVAAEAASIHEIDLDRYNEMTQDNAEIVLAGQLIRAVDYLRALRMRNVIQTDFAEAFSKASAIIMPGAVCTAPKLSDMLAEIGGELYPWLEAASRTVRMHPLAGIPSLAVPFGFADNSLPVGIQIAAPPNRDEVSIRVALALQEYTSFHKEKPPMLSMPNPS